jgi:hypothetical protein
LKGKSRKTFDNIMSSKPVFFLNFGFEGFGGASAPHHPYLGCAPGADHTVITALCGDFKRIMAENFVSCG